MGVRRKIRMAVLSWAAPAFVAVCGAQPASSDRILLDRVVAVVNNGAILASDVDREERLSILEPESSDEAPDARSALERLISRTIIQQQIRREEEQEASPSEDQVQTRLAELRKELPACVRFNCTTDGGWTSFLFTHALTQKEVENYLRGRLEMLSFIENRFQQGIRIAPEEIDDYYNKTLLPQYPKGQAPPPLSGVSHRIEEILLQQRVNNMFSSWLDNLRKQGDVEILDPALEPAGQTVHSESVAP